MRLYSPVDDFSPYMPKLLPSSWALIDWPIPTWDNCGSSESRGLRVMMDAGYEEDGSVWIHASASRRGRTPSWEDMDLVKRLFIGNDRVAYQVHPKSDEHYTLSGNKDQRLGTCLHLWAPVDDVPRLPNFLRARGGTI